LVGARRALRRCTLLGALAFAGRVLPDATLRGMRMFRSHGGTVPAVPSPDLSSEAFSPGSAAPCREQRARRGADMPATFNFASSPLPRGRHRLVAGRWPRVTGLTSCLSGCFRLQPGAVFCHAPRSRRLADFARSARSPRSCFACASNSDEPDLLAGLARQIARPRSGLRSSNRYLSATASTPDSKPLGRLTRLGAVSDRALPHSS
jgi:hypothetical protein